MEEECLAGCCGLYCGLCSRFQSKAPSGCLGCHLGDQHSYCSIYRCCVNRGGLLTCADWSGYRESGHCDPSLGGIPAENYCLWEVFVIAPVFLTAILAAGAVELLSKPFRGGWDL